MPSKRELIKDKNGYRTLSGKKNEDIRHNIYKNQKIDYEKLANKLNKSERIKIAKNLPRIHLMVNGKQSERDVILQNASQEFLDALRIVDKNTFNNLKRQKNKSITISGSGFNWDILKTIGINALKLAPLLIPLL